MHKEYNFWKAKYSEEKIREFIKKYPEKCCWDFWYVISYRQGLSENFISEFQYKVDWYLISRNQDLSEKFLIEFIDKIDIRYLKYNKKILENIKNRIIMLRKVRGS